MEPRSLRAASLAAGLRHAAARLVAVIEPLDREPWRRVPGPGTWSVGKEAEHAVEALAYHAWIVRRTIGARASSRRPTLERRQLASNLSPADVSASLRERVEETERLILALSDRQLGLPTKPPRPATPILAETIQRVLIDHLHAHRVSIEAKLHP